jgi:hypothetical protein
MPLYIPADHYDVSFIMESAGLGQVAVNTIGFHYTGSDFQTDAQQTELQWTNHLMVQISSEWTFTRAIWRIQTGALRDAQHTSVGGINSQPLPPNCAVLVRKTTLVPGRQNRGRWFLPGVAVSGVDGGGNLSSGLKTDWQIAVSNFKLGVVPLGMHPVVLHNVASLANTTGKSPTAIDDFVVMPKIATQRRRLRD